ncbi:MAG TPA: PIN domain-containing protein [Puia sp.]|uniref:PIN domain-containing protein n=1 Tax=Puia sp. TaxID=2045100 RepID=UPI002CA23C70|nr:PIN domain-containing protein [Puia sp.]HVU97782.1 PIN domain-containing protein [Puia sp.]
MVTPAMPIFLILDNNALKALANPDFLNPKLDLLAEVTTLGMVCVAYPEALQEEWVRHKENHLTAIRKMEREKAKVVRLFEGIVARENTLSDQEFEEIKRRLQGRVQLLDEILEKYSVKINRYNDLDSRILDWRRKKKAPFHQENHKDHFNDAEILYYSLDHIRQSNQTQVLFISNDQGAYSKSQQEKQTIHPDCLAFCPEVTIFFFNDVSAGIDQLEAWLFPERTRQPEIERLGKSTPVNVDRSLSIIQQVLAYLQHQQGICVMWPPHLLMAQYPFLTDASYASLHRPYTLITDNQELYDLLIQVRIDEDEVTYLNGHPPLSREDEEALRQVFSILFSHLLFRVAFKLQESIAFQFIARFADNTTPFRYFHTLNLPGLLQFLRESRSFEGEPDPQNMMAIAYYYYKTQQYKSAALLLLKLREGSLQLSPVQRYIVHFNLSLLQHLLARIPPGDPEVDRLEQICRNIDLGGVKDVCCKSAPTEIIEYIHYRKFHYEPLLKVSGALEDIRRLYDQQSWGNSTVTEMLIEQFFLVTTFLSENYIFFDEFGEFEILARGFAQGLITAPFCNALHTARLPQWNDTFCYELILYGNGDDLRRWANKHQFFNIPYIPNGDRPPVYEALAHLFDGYERLYSGYYEFFEREAPFFSQQVDRWLYNGLVVCALCQLPADGASLLFNALLNFLSNQTHSFLYQIKTGIAFFVWNQRQNLSIDQYHALFGIILDNPNLRDDSTLSSFVYTMQRVNISIKLSQKTSAGMRALLEQHPNKSTPEWENFCDLYERLEIGPEKDLLSDFAREILKLSFTPDGYYHACLARIVEPAESYDRQYKARLLTVLEAGPGVYMAVKSFYTNSTINQYINFCWCFDLNLPKELIEKAPMFGLYYVWLTDIDHFDYRQFDLEWLNYYFSKFYKKRYRRSAILRDYVLLKMQERRNPALERFVAATYTLSDLGEG